MHGMLHALDEEIP